MVAEMIEIPRWVREVQEQMDSWAAQRRAEALSSVRWPPRWHWKLPWQEDKRRKEELQEEYRRRKMQIEDLCGALKVETLADLQDVLGAIVLAESVYKRPEEEVLAATNTFKAEFGGGQLIALNRLQVSLEHVPHRYLLAEGGDTLFAAFIGTKQYRDYITDANFLQGALFHDEGDEAEAAVADEEGARSGGGGGSELSTLSNLKPKAAGGAKPAAHRGFLARAKGIPALELYRLAQKKDCKLVLCGHSLGGAVAALATLAILRVFATADVARAGGRLQIKCITFSQPPVGNAALRDYVHNKGWHHHFPNYCIPEDLIPRLLSPAYFQHYRSQASGLVVPVPPSPSEATKPDDKGVDRKRAAAGNRRGSNGAEGGGGGGERMIMGVGPLPKYDWRLPKLVPILGAPRPFQWFRGRNRGDSAGEASEESSAPELQVEVAPLEIQENLGSVSLLSSGPPDSTANSVSVGGGGEQPSPVESTAGGGGGKTEVPTGEEKLVAPVPEGVGRNGGDWLKRVPSVSVPSLPSYVPFGQLFLLERSSISRLSAAEYTQLSSVQSVIQELKERFRSHTMRSYRTRFLRIYHSCMSDSSAFKVEPLQPYLPNLQSWLGILGSRIIEQGSISEPIVLRTATSLVPLGWTGLPGEKGEKPLLVDVQGFGLHHCTLVRAQLNGHWCATTLESLPPPQQELQHVHPKLQKMRIRIGPPLVSNAQKTTTAPVPEDGLEETSGGGVRVANGFSGKVELPTVGLKDLGMYEAEGLGELVVQCSTDFMTASQDVVARLRRVRLLGLEGAGKTSLYFALLGKAGVTVSSGDGGVLPDMDLREGVANGINYVDAAGVSLQNLGNEAEQLRQELRIRATQRGKKLDLVILVHNLAHKIPRLHGDSSVPPRPALGLLLDEVSAAGIPVVLAITNKFAVSADRRHLAASTIMNTYRVSPNLTVVLNSCPYGVHGILKESLTSRVPDLEEGRRGPAANGIVQEAAQRFIFGPMKLVPRPFGRREVVLPPEGITELNSLVQNVLSHREQAAFDEHAKEQLALQTAEELVHATRESARFGLGKNSTAGAAAVGAAFGAGVGVFVAVVVSAAKALRKP